MKKTVKSIISMTLIFTMIFIFSSHAFAASGFHKVNGIGKEHGGDGYYYSTTTKDCHKITAQGTSDNKTKQVTIVVQADNEKGKVVASGVVTLNGKEKELENFYTTTFKAGTYYITVSTSDYVPYEVSTFFYE